MAEERTPEISSASRQKSCHACVKGKRGCDKRQPVCSRCEEKSIQCVYAKRTYAEAFHDFDGVELDMSWAGFASLSSPIDIPPSLVSSASLHTTHLSTLDAVGPFFTFEGNQAMSPRDMQLMISDGEILDQHREKEQALSSFDYAPMADICVCHSPVKHATANV